MALSAEGEAELRAAGGRGGMQPQRLQLLQGRGGKGLELEREEDLLAAFVPAGGVGYRQRLHCAGGCLGPPQTPRCKQAQ